MEVKLLDYEPPAEIFEETLFKPKINRSKARKKLGKKRGGPRLSQETPQNARHPIPDSCKGYQIPEDINRFITSMFKNMVYFVSIYVPEGPHRKDIIEDCVQSFVLYMLSPSPKYNMTPHWQLYDPSFNKGQMPYYKYFISHLAWFLKGVKRDYYKKRFNVSLSEPTFDETSDLENHCFNLDCLQPSEVHRLPQSNWPVSMTDSLYMKQIENYLFSISRNAKEEDLFASHVYTYFKLKVERTSNQEMADVLGVL